MARSEFSSSDQERPVASYEEGLFRPLINGNRMSRLRPPEYSQREVNTRMPRDMRQIFGKQMDALNQSLRIARERGDDEKLDDVFDLDYAGGKPRDRIIYSKQKPRRR